MSWFSSLLGHRSGQRVSTAAKRHSGSKNRSCMVLEQLERRDVPSTFLQVVSTPNYPTLGAFDAVSATVNGQSYQYAGIQFGAKLASSASALPGNGTPDFYGFCVDITEPANLTSAYQVATSPVSTLPNGGAIAYLYDTFNSPVSAPLDKTHAAALQLAIWEEEYGTNIVTQSDVSFMNNYNGATENTNLLNQASTYLGQVPGNPTAIATVYKSASSNDQSLIGPPDTIVTTQQPAAAVTGSPIADQALVSGINPTGTVTFNLYNNPTASGMPLFTDTQTLVGGVATSNSYSPTVSGTLYWVDTYNGDTNNLPVTSGLTAEPVVITPSITITTTPSMTQTSSGRVVAGEFATIGFWHNQNGQAVINSFNGSSSSTALGNWLASNFPNLFGASNPYISATLASFPGKPATLAGLTNAQVAAVYEGLWPPSGVVANTYVQAFAVALGTYADTTSLGGQSLIGNGLASKNGFVVSSGGGGSATFAVGGDSAAFNNNSGSLPVSQILQIVNNNFAPSGGTFYGGNQSLTSNANDVLNGINSIGDIPGTSSSQGGGSTITKLNDSATLAGGTNPTGNVTFYLLPPGSTSTTPLSAAVYTDTVAVNGNGTYATTSGTNPGGYVPAATGTYEWVAVYSGDSNNPSVTSPFGSEPQTVQATSTPGISIVKLTNGVNDPDPNGSNVPQLAPGSSVTWTYLVTNTGNVPFAKSNVVVTDNQPGVNPQPELNGNGFIVGDTNDNNILDPGETWTYIATGTALDLTKPPAGVTTVPLSGTGTSVGVSLGAAAGYAVVAVNGFTINGPGTITGNVASGNNTVLTNPAVINGTVYYSGSISGNSKPSGGEVSTNLSQVFVDAKTAASNAFALPATQTFGTINGSTTINGNGGTNVIDVSTIKLSSGALTLNGSASDIFIVNVTGDLTSSNSNIALSGGVTANHVLINVGGNVTITGGGPNNFYGTILDPNGQISVHDKLLTGQLIGNTITDTSGFSVNYPPSQNVYENTGTVTVTVSSANTTLSASYVSNYKNPVAVPQLVTGSTTATGISELLNSTSTLTPGKITVAVNLPKGPQQVAEAAAIARALANYNAELKPLGIRFVQVSGAQAATAQVHIGMASTTDIGGMAQGVLADYSLTSPGEITLVQGWNWYTSANPNLIKSNQYDFQSVVSHELGHFLGLDENNDPTSAMNLFLTAGQINRNLANVDLTAIAQELAQAKVGSSKK